MRNVIDRKSVVVYSVKTHYEPQPSIYHSPSESHYSFDAPTKQAARSDILKGNHVDTLPYRAYELNFQNNSFSIEKRSNQRGYFSGQGWVNYEKVVTAAGRKPINNTIYSSLGVDTFDRSPNVSQRVIDVATNRCLAKLKRQEATLGATLGEITELRGMMINKFITLLKTFLAVKRGRSSAVRRALDMKKSRSLNKPHKTFADAWLAYQLGWKPLMSEIFGLQEAIKEIANTRDMLLRVTSVQEEGYKPYFFHDLEFSGSFIQGCQVGIVARVDSDFPNWLNRLGAGNPLSIAWELLPLSFVTDWFVNIGRFLNLLDASVGLEFVSGYQTTFIRGDGTVTEPNWTPDGSSSSDWEGTPPSWGVDVFSMKRNILPTFPSARLHLGSGLGENVWRQLTATALLAARS